MGLYTIPQQFQDRLDETFGGKIRVRWSDEQQEWHVEQKVRRQLVGSTLVRNDDIQRLHYRDDVIRAKDDHVWIMSIKQGTKFACPTCEMSLTAPTRQTEMISCDHCRAKGYEHHVVACHWPMDETLIDHLKMLQWKADHPEQDDQLDKQNAAIRKIQERKVLDPTVAAWEDNFNKLAGIPSVGYTGRVFTGEN